MRVAAGVVTLAALGVGLVAGRADEPTKDDLLKLELQLKAAHEKTGPAVACVVVSRSDKYPKPAKPPTYPGELGGFDRAEFLKADPRNKALADRLDLSRPDTIPDHGFTGGLVIDPAGFVLVHYHAIDGATQVYVHLPGEKGSYADIHAADARSDLAVLRLLTPPEGVRSAKFAAPGGRPVVAPGQLVMLASSLPTPEFTAVRPAVGLGSVRSVHRLRIASDNKADTARRDYYSYAPLIEYEARVSVPVSGVALLNLDGEVAGLTTTVAAVTAREGAPGYAMPADEVFRRIVAVLRRGAEVEYGFLGVSKNQNTPGVTINDVTPNSPAALAGLRPLDTITRIDGHPIREFEDLLYYGGSALAGTTIRVTYLRAGQEDKADLTLAKFKSEQPFIASVRPEPVFGLRVDYASTLTPTVFTPGTLTGIPPGVAVRELIPDSPAAEKFKALGDGTRWAVTQVNGTPTRTPAEFYKLTKGQPSVRLTVIDPADRQPRDVTLP